MNKRRTALIIGGLVLVGGASLLAYFVRQRKDPSVCPYGLRFSLALPRLFVTRSRLREMLSPEPGERVRGCSRSDLALATAVSMQLGGWSRQAPWKS
jgi:hypothetical protein